MTVDQAHSPNESHTKDENTKITSQDVGLIFAREYYTFLNKRPDRLYAFYGSDSLLVRGDEGETVSTVKGQEEISKKIEELEFDNCKVLVTQVDSQLSANDGILVSVLGEMSNKGKPSQKFAETFFLAPQLNGYYILNNTFRYLKEKVDIDYYLCQENELEVTEPLKDVQTDAAQPKYTEKDVEESNGIEIKKTKKDDSSNKKVTPAKDTEKKPNVDAIPPNRPVSPLVVQEKASIPPTSTDKHTPAVAVAASTSANNNASLLSVEEKKIASITNGNSIKKTQPNSVKDNEGQMSNGYSSRDQRGAQKTITNTQSWARLAASTTSESANEPTRASKPPPQHHYHNQQAPLAQQAFNMTAHAQNNNIPHGNGYSNHPHQNNHHHSQQQINTQQQHVQNQHHQPTHYQHYNKEQQHHQNQHQHQHRNKDLQIFVKNVNSTMKEEHLEAAFRQFGSIKYVSISHSGNTVFIEFTSMESRQKALDQGKVAVGNQTVYAEKPRVNNQYHNNNNRRFHPNRRGGGGTSTANRSGGMTTGSESLNKRGGGATGGAGGQK